jgi:HEAT repeat protein
VLVLGLIPNDVKSARLAEKALTDDEAEVRFGCRHCLGRNQVEASIPKLRAAFDDHDPLVVLAATHSLDLMHDNSAYEVYYEVLNGERKAKNGLILSQASLFTIPKGWRYSNLKKALVSFLLPASAGELSKRSPRMTLLRSVQPPQRRWPEILTLLRPRL